MVKIYLFPTIFMSVTCKSFHEFEEKSKKVLELNEDKIETSNYFQCFFFDMQIQFSGQY